jgi:peptidoglycan/LPS O-acetylase OafA/YrhL
MNLGSIIKSSFVVSFVIILVGAYLKLIHSYSGDMFLKIAVAVMLVFIVSAIIEVWSSSRIDKNEKIMWSIAFIFMGTFSGIIYLLMGRKRVTSTN